MPKPYSLDLRERVVDYVEAGHSRRAAAAVAALVRNARRVVSFFLLIEPPDAASDIIARTRPVCSKMTN